MALTQGCSSRGDSETGTWIRKQAVIKHHFSLEYNVWMSSVSFIAADDLHFNQVTVSTGGWDGRTEEDGGRC